MISKQKPYLEPVEETISWAPLGVLRREDIVSQIQTQIDRRRELINQKEAECPEVLREEMKILVKRIKELNDAL